MSTLAVLAVALATQTATLGSTTATISWNADPFAHDLRVKIERSGQVVVDEALDKTLGPAGEQAVQVRDLDADGRPEVIVDGYSGGAHCCVTTYLWRPDGPRASHEWGNTGYRLRDVDGNGTLELDGYDDFSYAFGSYVESRQPIKILDASLRDVTTCVPRCRDARPAPPPERVRPGAGALRTRGRRWPPTSPTCTCSAAIATPTRRSSTRCAAAGCASASTSTSRRSAAPTSAR